MTREEHVKNMDLMVHYQQTVQFYKARYGIAFPVPTFEEWLKQQGITYHASQQPPHPPHQYISTSSPHIPQVHQISKPQSDESVDEQVAMIVVKASRSKWSKQQTSALIETWKENFEEIQSFKAPHAWTKIKNKIDEHGTVKTVDQIKNKLKTLKDAYKKAKDNNRTTGNNPMTCKFYDEIDEIFSMRHAVQLPEVKEIGAEINAAKTGETQTIEHLQDEALFSPRSPRSLFHPQLEMDEYDDTLDTSTSASAKDSDHLNSSFTDELKEEERQNRKRKVTTGKSEKEKKPKPDKIDKSLEKIVKLFKESEENQQKFFKEIINTQRKIDTEEKARDQAFFLQLATLLQSDQSQKDKNSSNGKED